MLRPYVRNVSGLETVVIKTFGCNREERSDACARRETGGYGDLPGLVTLMPLRVQVAARRSAF